MDCPTRAPQGNALWFGSPIRTKDERLCERSISPSQKITSHCTITLYYFSKYTATDATLFDFIKRVLKKKVKHEMGVPHRKVINMTILIKINLQ